MRNITSRVFTPGPLVSCRWEPPLVCKPTPQPQPLLAPSPWLLGGKATADEIYREWREIRSLQNLKGAGAQAFYLYTSLHLTPEAVDQKFRDEVNIRVRQLRAIFPAFDGFPADARRAMLVHAWANDPSSLKTNWPEYVAACRARRWKDHKPDPQKPDAATASRWTGVNPKRYQGMVSMFTQAQAVEDAAR
jgi:hypothetical protein